MEKVKKFYNQKFKDIEKLSHFEEEVITNSLDDFSDIDHYFSKDVFLRLKMSYDYIKAIYSKIRNELRKINLKYNPSNSYEVYLKEQEVLIQVIINIDHIKVYFNQSLENTSSCNLFNLKSFLIVEDEKTFDNFINVLNEFINLNSLVKNEDIKFIDYEKDGLTTSTELLKLLGYEKSIKKITTCELVQEFDSNIISNTIMYITNPFKEEGEVFSITVGELSHAFKGKYDITLFLLQEVGIASSNYKKLKVVAKGDCKHKMSVYADEFEVDAVKLIVLSGGNAIINI